ncbi:hypothetical protein [Paludisphaera sp.]|uniref:hypothetical protein n=1 Tax=Paludisphaera sp. TaxID=2017432 RepID=UPI00301D0D7C
MVRRVSRGMFWAAIVSVISAGGEDATAAPYYTATYLGNGSDVTVQQYPTRMAYNNATGDAYSFDSGTRSFDLQDAASLDLPKVTAWRGAGDPNPPTYQMEGRLINDATGMVVGRVANGGSRGMPWSSVNFGYTTPDANGKYTEFHKLVTEANEVTNSFLNPADQLLLQTNLIYAGYTRELLLFDLKTGTRTDVRDLVDPELWGRYDRFGVDGFSARGDILLVATPRRDYTDPDSPREEFYILTPPGLEPMTPVPEPSLLWLAAGAVGLGVRAHWRKSRDRGAA